VQPPVGRSASTPVRFGSCTDSTSRPQVLVDMSTIELTAADLYDKDKVDIEQLNLDDVWTLLQ
jgi:H+-transporting ATPase